MGLAYATSTAAPVTCVATRSLRRCWHPGQDRSAGDRRQGGAGQGVPGCDRGRRFAGLCVFTTFAWSMENIAPQVDAACEGDWSVDRMLEVGERIWNLERDFNMRAGMTADQDTLPKRLLKGRRQCRSGEGPGQRSGQDAAGVLRAAGLDGRWPDHAGDAPASVSDGAIATAASARPGGADVFLIRGDCPCST